MPTYASGLSGQVGAVAETTYGTPVTVTHFYEFLSENFQYAPAWLDGMGLKAGQAYNRASRTVVSQADVNGDLTMEHTSGEAATAVADSMGFWWKYALGSAFTTPVVVLGTAFSQTHTNGSKAGQFLTVQVGRPQISGVTVQPFCVDEQTEVLTQRGWITHHSLEAGDRVLSLDPETREILWEPVISVHRFEHDGPLTRWKSQRMDALTTPNHRWLVETKRRRAPLPKMTVCPECGAAGLKRVATHRARMHGIHRASEPARVRAAVFTGKPAFRTTEELASRYDYIITGGGTPACFAPAPVYTDEFVELVGWVITEGHYQSAPGYQARGVVIAQDAAVNPGYAERIRALAVHFRAEGATVSEYGYGDDPRLHWYFGKGIDRVIRLAAPGKQLTPEFLCALTEGQARLLYQTLIDGDGHRHAPQMSKGIRRGGGADTETWAQKDPGRINGFQMLAAMLGKRTWAHLRNGGCSDVSVHQDTHCIGKTMPAAQEDYKGIVWCPRTRTQTWLARRSGCTYWTGNTYTGTKITDWEFSCNDNQIAQLKVTCDGQTELTSTALAAASYPPPNGLFSFANASVMTLGGTPSTTAGVTTIAGGSSLGSRVNGVVITGSTPMKVDRYGLGNAGLKGEPIENAIPTITGTLSTEFFSRTELYDVFKTAGTTPLQIDFTKFDAAGNDANGAAAGANPYRLSVILPAVKFKTAAVNVGSPDVIPQSIGFQAYDDGTTNPVIQVKIISKEQTI